jgi:hypothetical protein
MKVRLLTEQQSTAGALPAGTEIEHPDAYRLAQLGVAEPIDDEAKEKMAEFEAQQEARRERAAKLRQQIAEQKKADRVASFARKLGVDGPENRKLKTK